MVLPPVPAAMPCHTCRMSFTLSFIALAAVMDSSSMSAAAAGKSAGARATGGAACSGGGQIPPLKPQAVADAAVCDRDALALLGLCNGQGVRLPRSTHRSTRAKSTAEHAATGWKQCNPAMSPALPNIGIVTETKLRFIATAASCGAAPPLAGFRGGVAGSAALRGGAARLPTGDYRRLIA